MIKIDNKLKRNVNGIERCFVTVNGIEYKIPKKYYDIIEIDKEYMPNKNGMYKLQENIDRLYPLNNYIIEK